MIRCFRNALIAGALLIPMAAHGADERLVTRLFNDNDVVRIAGRLGVQATIGFGENEHIENVAVGDSESWQITPNKRADLLFVKPLSHNARTNMTVVTDRHTYFFDLVASPQAKPLYMLRFTYKDEPKRPILPGEELALSDDERQAMDAAPIDPAMLNFAWGRKGSAELMPARIYDDGQATYLLWAPRQQVPAILVTNEKGDEGPVNYAVRGATIVIDDVPRQLVLRMGKKSATLQNQRPAPAIPAATSPVVAASGAASDQPSSTSGQQSTLPQSGGQ